MGKGATPAPAASTPYRALLPLYGAPFIHTASPTPTSEQPALPEPIRLPSPHPPTSPRGEKRPQITRTEHFTPTTTPRRHIKPEKQNTPLLHPFFTPARTGATDLHVFVGRGALERLLCVAQATR